ncbi:amidohydrolase family protein [Pseudarthrobacter sp. H2]|uniref:amidohydrolase family protein n=1 Tax=Pseudarthrobacter sp. H2 TaxID=3418415 RepID=UPI003CF6FE95
MSATPRPAPAGAAELQGTVIQAGRPATDMLITCRDGVISAVRPADRGHGAGGPRIFILPGLIDAHDHLAFKRTLWETGPAAGALMGELMHTDAAQMRREFEANARRILASGVTTVRDFGVDLGAGLSYAGGEAAATPRILTCGAPLGIPGGHLHHRARAVTTIEDVNRLLAEDIDAGLPWVKLFASGGIANYPQDPISVELSEKLMRAATDMAHGHGLRVAAHALPEESVLNAVRAGVDSIEHGVFLGDESVRIMADRGVWYVPTLAGYTRRVRALRAAGQHAAADAFERDVITPHRRSVRMAQAAGVRIAVGTDITASVVDEMEALMDEAGLGFDEVLAGATTGAAELLGLADGTGTIAVGARADLLVVHSDPREDIRALEDVVAVICAGQPVPA